MRSSGNNATQHNTGELTRWPRARSGSRARWVALAALLGCGIAVALVALRPGDENEHETPAHGRSKGDISSSSRSVIGVAMSPAAITGRVSAANRDGVGGATVCALAAHELGRAFARDPLCATTRKDGTYALQQIPPASYEVWANASGYQPAGLGTVEPIRLRAGEHRRDADILLTDDGVELSGTVGDIGGGPIVGAMVVASSTHGMAAHSVTTTDSGGNFRMWVSRGDQLIAATAGGYVGNSTHLTAPANRVDIALTPESVLAGRVVEAGTDIAVAGVVVFADRAAEQELFARFSSQPTGSHAVTDREGRFRLDRLPPGTYAPVARSDRGYGQASVSVSLGLGETSDEILIELHPAARVAGRVVLPDGATGCEQGRASLTAERENRFEHAPIEADGHVLFSGILPGAYTVRVRCAGYRSRAEYPVVEVADQDRTDLIWRVDVGNQIAGIVVDSEGHPAPGVALTAFRIGGAGSGERTSATSGRDGSFRIQGLGPGLHRLEADPADAPAPEPIEVDLGSGSDAAGLRIRLPAGGAINGRVADANGHPVSGVSIHALGTRRQAGGSTTTREDGSFELSGLAPGRYSVTASRTGIGDLRSAVAGSSDSASVDTIVEPGSTSMVELTVEQQSEQILGRVLEDRSGSPLADAFVLAERQPEDASDNRARATTRSSIPPVLTDLDGSFVLAGLAPGTYTVRAYRVGGGDAVSTNVRAGTEIELRLRETASLTGTVTVAGTPADSFSISVDSPATGFACRGSFYRTGGRFSLEGLPPGDFTVRAETAAGTASSHVQLVAGQERDGLTLTVEARATVRGRLTELNGGEPVPDLRVMARSLEGGEWILGMDDPANRHVSDRAGRFELRGVPAGRVTLLVVPVNQEVSAYRGVEMLVRVAPGEDLDLGDIAVVRTRVGWTEREGELGYQAEMREAAVGFAEDHWVVVSVSPNGPAASAGLASGDAIARVDGTSVTGSRAYLYPALTEVPPGHQLTLEVTRGNGPATIVIVARPPRNLAR